MKYIPKKISYVSLNKDQNIHLHFNHEIKVYINGNILGGGRNLDHTKGDAVSVKGDYVAAIKPGRHRIVVREANQFADNRIESNTVYFDLVENEVAQFVLSANEDGLKLEKKVSQHISDNGVTFEQAFHHWLETELNLLPEPLPRGLMLFIDANQTILMYSAIDFNNEAEFDQAMDDELDTNERFDIPADVCDWNEYEDFIAELTNTYLLGNTKGAQRLKTLAAVGVLDRGGVSKILHWRDEAFQRPVPQATGSQQPNVKTDEASFYFWAQAFGIPERLSCHNDSSCITDRVELLRGEVLDETTVIQLKSRATVSMLSKMPTLSTAVSLPVVSPALRDIIDALAPGEVQWIDVNIMAADGIISSYKALNVLSLKEVEIDEERSLSRNHMHPSAPYILGNPLGSLNIITANSFPRQIVISKSLRDTLHNKTGPASLILTNEQLLSRTY